MPVRGFVELVPDMDPDLLGRLVWTAQRIARDGRVILALNGISGRTVNRFLTPWGEFNGVDGGGLRYRTLHPIDEPLLALAREARFVIADSERLSRILLCEGILHMRAREGVRYLLTLLPPEEHHPGCPNGGLLASW